MPPTEERLRLSFTNWVVGGTLIVNRPASRLVSGVVTSRKKTIEASSKVTVALTEANAEANKEIILDDRKGCCKECSRDCNCKVSDEAKLLESTDATDPKLTGDTGNKVVVAGDGSNGAFTTEQDALLRSLKAENRSWKEICSRLGMTKHALHQRYKELIKIEHQAAAANDTNGVALMSGANPAVGTKNSIENPQNKTMTTADEKRDDEDDPFGGIFEEVGWGTGQSGDQDKAQKSNHVSSNGEKWGNWKGKNRSNSTNFPSYDGRRWSGNKKTHKNNQAGNHSHSNSKTRENESIWVGYQASNNDNNATSNTLNNNGYTWGGDQIVDQDNANNSTGNIGASNSDAWAWGGEQTTDDKYVNSYSKNPPASQSAKDGGSGWSWGRNLTTDNNAGGGDNGAWGGDPVVDTKNTDQDATYQAAGQHSNSSGVHWRWGDSMPSSKNIDGVQNGDTPAFEPNKRSWGPEKDHGGSRNGSHSDFNNAKINIDNANLSRYPRHPSYTQVYYPQQYPSVPHPLSYPPPFTHQTQPHQLTSQPIPLNPLTGRLQPDAVWSLRDCAILEFLMSRHASEQWMTMQAGFFNWTGRMMDANLIKGKFEGDGLFLGAGGGVDGRERGGERKEREKARGGGGNWD